MNRGEASGLQIAFLVFAVMLLSAPTALWLTSFPVWPAEMVPLVQRTTQFVVAAFMLALVPPLRRFCSRELQRAPGSEAKREAVIVGIAKILIPIAWAGGMALWYLNAGGEAYVAQLIGKLDSHDAAMKRAFSPPGVALGLVLAVFVGPIIEELVFRGLLYQAWERQLGWFPAMLATSAMFAVYHQNFVPSFLSSVVFVCVVRRTGTLWGSIIPHAIYNFLIYYPFLGQFVFPRQADAPGDLSSWSLQLACLLALAIVLPAYIWMARQKSEPIEDFPPTVVDGAVSK